VGHPLGLEPFRPRLIHRDYRRKPLGKINASAFYYDYKGYQVNSAINLGTPPVLRSVFTNAGAATVKGFEVEAVLMPSPRFRVDGSFGNLSTRFDDLSQAFDAVTGTRVDMTGNSLPRAPQFTWRASVRYDAPLGSGTLTPSFSIQSQSDQFFSEFNGRVFTVGVTTVTRYVPLKQDGWAMINASLRYEANEGRWFIEGFGQNLGNQTVLVTGALNANRQPSGSYAPPRTYGVRIGGKF
jgi:iron complex outermembrane recepter protein